MITEFGTVAPDDSLTRAVEHVLAGCQQDFPVVENGRVVGVLTRADLLKAMRERMDAYSLELMEYGAERDEHDIRWLDTMLEAEQKGGGAAGIEPTGLSGTR